MAVRDGERCLAFRNGCELRLLSRNRKPRDRKYPEVAAALRRQETAPFIADGEIVAFEDGVTSFARLQRRMQVERPSADLLRSVPIWLYLFDLLYLDRYDIREVPLRYRKEVLLDAFDFEDALRFTEHCEREGEAYYRAACRRGWEG
jgi:bifunctional non-homologous end joining protein LigD